MTRPKKPVGRDNPPPTYPNNHGAAIHRRRFMGILAGSAAVTLLGCKDEGCEMDRIVGTEARLGGAPPLPTTDQDAGPRIEPGTPQTPGPTPLTPEAGSPTAPAIVAVTFKGVRVPLDGEAQATYALEFTCTDESTAQALRNRTKEVTAAANKIFRNLTVDQVQGPAAEKKIFDKLAATLGPLLQDSGATLRAVKISNAKHNLNKGGGMRSPDDLSGLGKL